MQRLALSTLFALSAVPCIAYGCWDEAGQRYGISPHLLYAMAQVESSLNANAVNRSHLQRTRSYDIGLMQINSSNLRGLARHGIKESDLYDACTNIHVGAWLLSQQFARYGVSWEAVGAYNAACTQLKGADCQRARSDYAWRVYRRLTGQSALEKTTAAKPAKSHVPAPRTTAAPVMYPLILSARVSP